MDRALDNTEINFIKKNVILYDLRHLMKGRKAHAPGDVRLKYAYMSKPDLLEELKKPKYD